MTEIKMDVSVKALLEEERASHKETVDRLNKKINNLKSMLKYEKERREYVEKRLSELEAEPKVKRKRRTKAEMEAVQPTEYSEFKKNGVRKKSKMDPIKSYTDFKKIQDYFLEHNELIYYVIWTVGVSMGLRASDIVTLKWKNVLEEDLSFKERVKLYEQKTSKLQNCLITESIKAALTKLLNECSWKVDMESYIFPGAGGDKPMTRSPCYEHLKRAAKAVGIKYNIGTHTMRESFANIVLCVDDSTIDMNAITKIQGLLNHSDSRVTLKYLGKLDEMYDKSRQVVSDFVLGKTGVDELTCGSQISLSSLMEKLDSIQQQIEK